MHDLNRALHQKRSEYENTQHKAIFLDKLAKEMMKQINLESQSGNNYRMRLMGHALTELHFDFYENMKKMTR